MKAIFILFLVNGLWYCNNKLEKDKINDIPESAVWKGGADGGCWVDIKIINDSLLSGSIYHENGDLWSSGHFIKKGECELERERMIHNITSYDGSRLLTNTNCFYQIINK